MKKGYFSLSVLVLLCLSFIFLIGVSYNKHSYLQETITGKAAAPIGGEDQYCMGDCFISVGTDCPPDYYLFYGNYIGDTGACQEGQNCCIPDGEYVCASGSGLCDEACVTGEVEAIDGDDINCLEGQRCCIPVENCNGLNCNPPISYDICGDGVCGPTETCEGCIDDCEGLGNDGGDTVCSDDYYCSRYDFFGNEDPGCRLACEASYGDPSVCFHEQAGCFNFGYEYTQPYSPTACGTHGEGCCRIVPLRDQPPVPESYCGNGICELSRGESCDECYIDCQGLRADCGFEEVCLYDDNARDPICKVSCSNDFPCGCFERECPRAGPGYEYQDFGGEVLFYYSDITGGNPGEYLQDINYNCLELHDGWPHDPPEPHFEYWRECWYESDTRGFMEVIIPGVTPGFCNDGTQRGDCSLTQPLFCRSNDELVNLCSECGCSPGYYCDIAGEVCLTNQSYIQINETNTSQPQLSPGTGDEESPALWQQLQRIYGISQEGSAVSATVLRRFAEGDDKGIFKSPGKLVTEVVKTKDVDEILKLSEDSVERTDAKVKMASQIFESESGDDIEDLLFEGDEDSNIGFVGDVIMQAAATSNGTNESPDLGPPFEEPEPIDIDPIEIPCVNETGDTCIGNGVECCEGLVCTQGICKTNFNVTPMNYSVGVVEEEEEQFTELVAVDIEGSQGGISVSEYETHPEEVEELEIPNSVTFGFYDIKSENEIGASLSFEVLNDLLVVNQIASIGLYRLTDSGWESLPLEEVVFNSERTRFTFNTEGFSYFTLKGVKEGVNFKTATEQDDSLWSVYRRSFTPGFALVEFFIGDKDTIIFGIFNNAPLIDLGLSGFS